MLEHRKSGARADRTAALLDWYDRNRRTLPWRAQPGRDSDPYGVWLSEIMLQQTTVAAVKSYYEKFLTLWPDVGALAAAPRDEIMKAWAGLGYYSRARNLHACAGEIVQNHGGRFPKTEHELLKLPGIGPYTAAAIAAIAFGQKASVIDGNVERVITRLFAIETRLPAAKPEIRRHVDALTDAARPGDFAQGMMDLGATICTPRRPACALCPFAGTCLAQARGDAENFPRKAAKLKRPQRKGAVFFVTRSDGKVLVRQRPPRGLLGGMTEFPGTDWTVDFDPASALADAPVAAKWRQAPDTVRHVFTHFELELTIITACLPRPAKAPGDCRWVALADLAEEALPSLMRKVALIGSAQAG